MGKKGTNTSWMLTVVVLLEEICFPLFCVKKMSLYYVQHVKTCKKKKKGGEQNLKNKKPSVIHPPNLAHVLTFEMPLFTYMLIFHSCSPNK